MGMATSGHRRADLARLLAGHGQVLCLVLARRHRVQLEVHLSMHLHGIHQMRRSSLMC